MKKLSALIAMVLCLTIGGVYAAWTYTNPDADITDEKFEQLVIIPSATAAGAAGEYEIITNITGMTIDQLGTNDQDKDFHTAVLNYTTKDGEAPYIKFTLKLRENTGSDIFDTLESTYEITVVGASEYKTKSIFVDKVAGTTVIDWDYDDINDIYYYEITDLSTEIVLNDFVLASKSEHTLFTTALGRAVLEVKLSDGVAAA